MDILSSRTNSEQDFTGSEASSRRPSKGSRRGSFKAIEEAPAKQYRVTMLGASGVGKSSLTSQFLSSDHMNTYDTVGKCLLTTKVSRENFLNGDDFLRSFFNFKTMKRFLFKTSEATEV